MPSAGHAPYVSLPKRARELGIGLGRGTVGGYLGFCFGFGRLRLGCLRFGRLAVGFRGVIRGRFMLGVSLFGSRVSLAVVGDVPTAALELESRRRKQLVYFPAALFVDHNG